MRKFCTFLRLFVLKLFCGNICTLQLFHLGTLCSDLYSFTISGDRTFCDWQFAIINFVITKYHYIIINFFENVAPFQIFIYWYLKILFCWSALFIVICCLFLACLFKRSLCNIVVYGSCICIFFMNIFGNRSIAQSVNVSTKSIIMILRLSLTYETA